MSFLSSASFSKQSTVYHLAFFTFHRRFLPPFYLYLIDERALTDPSELQNFLFSNKCTVILLVLPLPHALQTSLTIIAVCIPQVTTRVVFWIRISAALFQWSRGLIAETYTRSRSDFCRLFSLRTWTGWCLIYIDHRSISFVNHLNYLGVVFERKITWVLQI